MKTLKLAVIAISVIAFSFGTLPNLMAGCVSGKTMWRAVSRRSNLP